MNSNMILSAKNLKELLWKTLQQLENKDIEVSLADAMALQSREIIRVIKSQQSIIKQAGENLTQELVEYATK